MLELFYGYDKKSTEPSVKLKRKESAKTPLEFSTPPSELLMGIGNL
jgi:hypothetical protein